MLVLSISDQEKTDLMEGSSIYVKPELTVDSIMPLAEMVLAGGTDQVVKLRCDKWTCHADIMKARISQGEVIILSKLANKE